MKLLVCSEQTAPGIALRVANPRAPISDQRAAIGRLPDDL